MVAQGQQQENADQENDNRDADRCSGQQFQMKMALAKKPITDAAEDRPSADFNDYWYGGVDRRIYHDCNKAALLPLRLFQCRSAPNDLQSRVSTRSSPSTNPRPARQNESHRPALTSAVRRSRLVPFSRARHVSSRRPSNGPFCKENHRPRHQW